MFGRSDSSPLDTSMKMIEKLIKEWNLDPEKLKDKQKNLWYLKQGSADFHIEIFKYNKGQNYGEVDCIEVGAIIMKLPDENILPFYRKLLELNSTSVGVYFALRGNLVMLISTRECEGIDYQELKVMVDEVRFFADYWDEILMKEFGGTK